MQQPPTAHREVRIGLTMAFAWLGFLGTLVILSFFLGLYIGKKSGFEAAKETSLEELARAPIDAPTGSDVVVPGDSAVPSTSSADSIYQKLQAAPTARVMPSSELPTLGKIAGVEESPIELQVSPDKAAKAVKDAASTAAAIVGGAAGSDINKKAEQLAKAFAENEEVSVGGTAAKALIDEATPTPTVVPPQKVEAVKTLGDIVSGATTTTLEVKKAQPTPSATKAPLVVPMIPEPTRVIAATPTLVATPVQKVQQTAIPTAQPTMAKEKATPIPQPSKAAVVEATPGLATTIAQGWYAQVAAPQKMIEAQEIVTKLSRGGFKAKIERAEVKGEQYYRVIVGPEKSKDAANNTAAKLKKSGLVNTTPFIKNVK